MRSADFFLAVQTQKDIPTQFFLSPEPLHATVVLGSFGSAQGLISDAFDIEIKADPSSSPAASTPVRYGKRPQIHHIFREPTKYGYKIVSVAVSLVIAATLPVVVGVVRFAPLLVEHDGGLRNGR